MFQDLIVAIRISRAREASTFAAVLSLALSIAMAVTLFSFADVVLLRPLPVKDPQGMFRVFTHSAEQPYGLTSWQDYLDLRSARCLASSMLYSQIFAAIGSNKSNAQIKYGLAVTENFFEFTGAEFKLGSGFRANDATTIVLSESFWRNEFGSDLNIVGRNIEVMGQTFIVVGVTSNKFTGLNRFVRETFYLPMAAYTNGPLAYTATSLQRREARFLVVYARLTPGFTRIAAQDQLSTMFQALAKSFPASNTGKGVRVEEDFKSRILIDKTYPPLAFIFLISAVTILFLSFSNVAGILLQRTVERAGEMSMRTALGATSLRILRQLMVEGAMISLVGSILGTYLSTELMTVISSMRMATDMPFSIAVDLSHRALIAMVVFTFASVMVISIVPWLQARRGTSGPRFRKTSIMGDLLVVTQSATATTLLFVGSGILSSVYSVQAVNLGFRNDDKVMTVVIAPTASAPMGEDLAKPRFNRTAEEVRAISGVRSASLAIMTPLSMMTARELVQIKGAPIDAKTTNINSIDEYYLPMLQIPFVRGDNISRFDKEGTAVINAEFAKQFSDDPIGKYLVVKEKSFRIVGVVRTSKYILYTEDPTPMVFISHDTIYYPRQVLHVESFGSPDLVRERVLAVVKENFPGVPLSEVRTLRSRIEGSLFTQFLAAKILTPLAVVGLFLACLGIYTTASFSGLQRKKEVAIRMAVGARKGEIVWLLTKRWLISSTLGFTLGLPLSWFMFIVIKSFVGAQVQIDYGSIVVIDVLLFATSIFAILVPAYRMAGADPSESLKQS